MVATLGLRDASGFIKALDEFSTGQWGAEHQAALRAAGLFSARAVDDAETRPDGSAALSSSLSASFDWFIQTAPPLVAAGDLDRAAILDQVLGASPDTWAVRPSPVELAALTGTFAACCWAGVEADMASDPSPLQALVRFQAAFIQVLVPGPATPRPDR